MLRENTYKAFGDVIESFETLKDERKFVSKEMGGITRKNNLEVDL